MSTNVKLSKAKLSIIIQSGQFLGKIIDNMMNKMVPNLGRKVLLDFGVPLATDILPQLATDLFVLDFVWKKNKWVRSHKSRKKNSPYSFRMMLWMILLKS